MGIRKEVSVVINDISGGLNMVDPESDVGRRYMSANGRRQVTDSLDIMMHVKKQRPGSIGKSSIFTTYCKGLGVYLRESGTEYLLSVSGGKLYRHDKTHPYGKTEMFDLTGTGNAWMQNYKDVCIVANGTEVVKVEGTSAYRLGIAAPTGATSSLVAGGTLPDGVYNIIFTHTRKVSGSAVLHSTGQVLTAQTCGSGNNTIRVTFSNASSTDAQITHVSAWMTDAGGTVYYYYGEAAIAAGTVDITSNANKNTALLYSVQAQRNYTVPNFQYILVFNNYLYGVVGNTVYRSLQAGTRYDLERFDTRAIYGNLAEYPYQITGIYAIDPDIYINTNAGIIKIPNGDLTAQFEHVEKNDNFKYPHTVKAWNGGLIGLTTNKLGFFDGAKIYPHDIAQDVKSEVQKIFDSYNTDLPPCAEIYRRSDRLEYHLGYKDNLISTTHNNRRLVCNLDTVTFMQDSKTSAAWEKWSNGFSHMVVDNFGKWYCVQSLSGNGVIYTENKMQNRDTDIYAAGALSADKEYGWMFKTGRFIHSIRGIVRWMHARLYAKYGHTITIAVDTSTWPNTATYDAEATGTSGSESRYGIARYGVSRYAPETPILKKVPLTRSLKGVGVVMTVSATGDDKTFQLYEMGIFGILTQSRFT
jgi:hypothetical protein